MKYAFFLMMAPVLLLSGCSKNDTGENAEECVVGFRVSLPETKGTKASVFNNIDDLSAFLCTGYDLTRGNAIIDQDLAIYYGEYMEMPIYTTLNTHYWRMGGVAAFYALAPQSFFLNEDGEPINIQMTGGGAIVEGKLDQDTRENTEILIGDYIGEGIWDGENKMLAAPIKFVHTMTAVRFVMGDMAENISGYTGITKVEISNVPTKATFEVAIGSPISESEWEAQFSPRPERNCQYMEISAAPAEGEDIGDEPFILFPQDLSEEPVTISVYYTDSTHDSANPGCVSATISASSLEAGKRYTITLNLKDFVLTIDDSVSKWTTDTENVIDAEEKEKEYVEIPAKYDGTNISTLKWYKENLAISASGHREYNHTGHINGDYFQWATYAGFCGDASAPDKGLLIYSSFTSNYCGDAANSVTFKGANRFKQSDAPYYEGIDTNNPFSKYNYQGATLELSDDVANIVLGGSWRTPTYQELSKMVEATFWARDDVDRGWYVFSPTEAHAANTTASSIPSDISKDNALLFFPYYLGYVADGTLYTNDESGYWTSTTATNVKNGNIRTFIIGPSDGRREVNELGRHFGCLIRPVSE